MTEIENGELSTIDEVETETADLELESTTADEPAADDEPAAADEMAASDETATADLDFQNRTLTVIYKPADFTPGVQISWPPHASAGLQPAPSHGHPRREAPSCTGCGTASTPPAARAPSAPC